MANKIIIEHRLIRTAKRAESQETLLVTTLLVGESEAGYTSHASLSIHTAVPDLVLQHRLTAGRRVAALLQRKVVPRPLQPCSRLFNFESRGRSPTRGGGPVTLPRSLALMFAAVWGGSLYVSSKIAAVCAVFVNARVCGGYVGKVNNWDQNTFDPNFWPRKRTKKSVGKVILGSKMFSGQKAFFEALGGNLVLFSKYLNLALQRRPTLGTEIIVAQQL